jgi:hypothetical protein
VLIEETKRLTNEFECNASTIAIRGKLTEALKLFSQLSEAYERLHSIISHSRPLTETLIDDAVIAIQDFMAMVRSDTLKISPKHHLLEHHCIPWMRMYKFGMGLHGEQGGEQLHSTVAKVEVRSRGIRNKIDQARHVMEAMIVQTSPALIETLPNTRK